MRGIDVLKNVYLLIDEEIPEDSLKVAQQMVFINQILQDMKTNIIISDLNQEINLTQGLCSGLIYGTAMLLTASKGDSIRQQYFSELYNLKRGLTGNSERRKDSLPVSLW